MILMYKELWELLNFHVASASQFFIKIYEQIKTTITSVIIKPDRFFLSLFQRLASTTAHDHPLRQLMKIFT
jgi:hypothetical protein